MKWRRTEKSVRVWEASPVPAGVARRHGLVCAVHAMLAKLLFPEEAYAGPRKDRTLNEADGEFALQVAQPRGEDAGAFDEAAWAVVKVGDAGRDSYGTALRRAQAAVRLAPGDGGYLNTLGLTCYRRGGRTDRRQAGGQEGGHRCPTHRNAPGRRASLLATARAARLALPLRCRNCSPEREIDPTS